METGIALASYNDPGWGQMVREGKYETLAYSDALVEAAARTVERSDFRPEWLTWVPSAARPELVPEFARRLAARLDIPAVDALRRVRAGAPQKSMVVAEAQALNVWGSFEAASVPSGRCLLVDDIVDSGWTLTVAGMALRAAGSGPVMPLALATAKPRNSR